MRYPVALIFCLFVASGCASMRIENSRLDGTKTTVAIKIPVMPWQDTKTVINKLTISAKTNWTLVGFSGNQDIETNTNTLNAAERIVGAAVQGAVTGAIQGAK